jgi:uncharacterized protein (DUF1778 family)
MMARLTVTLSDGQHRALKEAAARRGKTIGELIEESLRAYGIKTSRRAAELVALARERAGLEEEAALEMAAKETRQDRGR